MRISNLTFTKPAFSFKNHRPQKGIEDLASSRGSIYGYKEIVKLYEFAQQNKGKNIAVYIFPTPLIDCKFVKTANDLNNKTGEWLDITDYDDNCY